MLARRLLIGSGGSFTPEEDVQFHGVRAFHDTTQTLTNGAHEIVELNSTDYDTNGYHDDVTNNHRLTIPSGFGGYYHIFAAVSIAGNATGQRLPVVCINEPEAVDGSTELLVPVGESNPSANANTHLTLNTVRLLADGDFIDLRIYQNSGVSLDLDIGSNLGDYVPSFGMHLVGT